MQMRVIVVFLPKEVKETLKEHVKSIGSSSVSAFIRGLIQHNLYGWKKQKELERLTEEAIRRLSKSDWASMLASYRGGKTNES